MKNIFLSLLVGVFVLSAFWWNLAAVSAACTYTKDSGPMDAIQNCQPDEALWSSFSSRDEFIRIINNLITVGGVLSMWGIAYSSMLFMTANGDDGKINKAKEWAKYAAAGFTVMIMASALVNSLVNLFFGIG